MMLLDTMERQFISSALPVLNLVAIVLLTLLMLAMYNKLTNRLTKVEATNTHVENDMTKLSNDVLRDRTSRILKEGDMDARLVTVEHAVTRMTTILEGLLAEIRDTLRDHSKRFDDLNAEIREVWKNTGSGSGTRTKPKQ